MIRSPRLRRQYAGYAVVIGLLALVVHDQVAGRVRARAVQTVRASLHARALLVEPVALGALVADGPTDALQSTVQRLGAGSGTRITVVDADGKVLADSRERPGAMDNHSDRPELLRARSGAPGYSTRLSETLAVRMMYVALPVTRDGQLLGFVRTALPLDEVERSQDQLRVMLAVAALAAVLLALAPGLLLVRQVSRSLDEMTAQAQAIARGDVERVPLEALGESETAQLGRAINQLSDELQRRLDKITSDHTTLSAILAGMGEGLVAIDRDARLLHLNEVAARLLRVQPDWARGMAMVEAIRIPEVCEALGQTMRERAVVRRALRVGDHSDRELELRAAPLSGVGGELGGAVLVLHDVTELRRLERVRQEFVANVSHELKTPLAAVRGLVETLINDDRMPAAQARKFLGRVVAQVSRMTALVEDLLTLARIESRQARRDRERLDLREIIGEIVHAAGPRIEQRRLQLEHSLPERPLWLHGNRLSLSQAVGNLIDNAVSYTPPGGRITVLTTRRGAAVEVAVSDTGIGIAPHDQERIFERFYRVDSGRSREMGGTGLGLAIVKHQALAHDGSVTVDSRPGVGSTFRLTLPLSD